MYYTLEVSKTTAALVGWDNMLQTFFAQLYMLDEHGERVDVYEKDGEEESGTLFWVGTSPNEIRTVDQLESLINKRFIIPKEIRDVLYEIEAD